MRALVGSVLFVLVAAASGCASARGAGAGGQPEEATVANLERARFAAMVAKDTAALGRYLASDLVYTHSNGAVETRDELLAHLASGQLRYGSIEPAEVRVRVLEQTAIINGRAELVVGSDRFDIRYLDVWVVRDGRWQMIAWQSTRLPQGP
jgi:hypothetical protein